MTIGGSPAFNNGMLASNRAIRPLPSQNYLQSPEWVNVSDGYMDHCIGVYSTLYIFKM